MVRALFICQRLEEMKYAGSKGTNVILTPVTAYNAPENKEFFQSTPSGEIKLYTVNQAAADQFEPGKKYYVDFSPYEEVAPE